MVPLKKGKRYPLVKGYYISALGALFLYGKDRQLQDQCSFEKGHQNSAPKGTVLQTIKHCPKRTILVPLIFLNACFVVSLLIQHRSKIMKKQVFPAQSP